MKLRPVTYFENAPQDPSQYDKFTDTSFNDFVSCLSTNESRIRTKAGVVAKGILADQVLAQWKDSLKAGNAGFDVRFWQTTYVFSFQSLFYPRTAKHGLILTSDV